MNVNASPIFPPIEHETRSHVNTACAAYWLSRQPQTLRAWACLENGPLRPKRINGRLVWYVADIKRILAEGAPTLPKLKSHSLLAAADIMKRSATSYSHTILAQALLDELGTNDPYPTAEELNEHRKSQLKDEMGVPNNMQHLHTLHAEEFGALIKLADIGHSFEMGGSVTLHFGTHDHKPIWLIDQGPKKPYAALFIADSLRAYIYMRQPFEANHLTAVYRDVALQTLKESHITAACDLGSGITIYCGTREKSVVWVMQNSDADGMCAVWFDDGTS